MNKKRYIISLVLFLSGCGQNALQKPEEESSYHDDIDTSLLSKYKIEVCGNLYSSKGPTGGSTGYFINSENRKRYNILADNDKVERLIISLNLPKEVCTYSNKELTNGYEGTIFFVQAIK